MNDIKYIIDKDTNSIIEYYNCILEATEALTGLNRAYKETYSTTYSPYYIK